MTHPLTLPNMVCHVLFEGQGWSPDHPDWLPLSLILAWASKLTTPKNLWWFASYMKFIKLYWKEKEKIMQDWSLKQSLLWAQVSQLTFNTFVKVGYYPLLPLAWTCILVCTVVVYSLWSYIVIVIWIN